MSTVHPPAPEERSRPTLLVMPGGLDVHGNGAIADRLALETEALLEALEESVARLALAHRATTFQVEDQFSDDEAFAWVQQSIEDVTATLRGLSLGRSAGAFGPVDAVLHSVSSPA